MTGFIMIKRCNPKDHPMSYYSCVKNINIKMKNLWKTIFLVCFIGIAESFCFLLINTAENRG
ncbi:MAG TPA: hypothetical protein DEB71_15190 [Chryseobacterium carnipullorum]|nr:hypothetical protein [Chryseobacterium carnipullorum]